MRIRLALLGAVLAALALALSCATPPPAVEPEAPPPAPAVEPAPEPAPVDTTVPAPDDLKSQATELRKKAFDLGLKDILPNDYAAADEAFARGGQKYGSDNAASAAAYEDAIARFGRLIEDGMPLLAASEGDAARSAEEAAFGAGAASYYYDECDSASTSLDDAATLEAAGQYTMAIITYRSTREDFAALTVMSDASDRRDRIAERDFAKWDSSNWSLAEAKLESAGELYGSDSKAAMTAADEAVLRFKLVWQNALSYYMDDRKTVSESERERASGIKSDVAARDEFEEAAALYESAEEKRAEEDLESASDLYNEAAEAFVAAYDLAKAKMDEALDELDSLDEALEAAADR